MSIIIDLNTVCLVCLQGECELRSVFEHDEETPQLATIADKISRCSDLCLLQTENNSLPHKICKRCLSDLATAWQFRQNCEIANSVIHSIKLQEKEDEARANLELAKQKIKLPSCLKIKRIQPETKAYLVPVEMDDNDHSTLESLAEQTQLLQMQMDLCGDVEVLEEDAPQLEDIQINLDYYETEEIFDENSVEETITLLQQNIKDAVVDQAQETQTKSDDVQIKVELESLSPSTERKKQSLKSPRSMCGRTKRTPRSAAKAARSASLAHNRKTKEENCIVLTNPETVIKAGEAVANSKEAVVNPEEAVANPEEAVANSVEAVANSGEAVFNSGEAVVNSGEAVVNSEEHEDSSHEEAVLNSEELIVNSQGESSVGDSAEQAKIRRTKLKSKQSYSRKRKSKPLLDTRPPKICDICGNSYKYQHALNAHMRRHTNDRPFPCEFCDKAFVSGVELRRHMRVHTGHKPYPCQYCERRFSDFGSRIKHERTHTGERPYSCDTCHKSFAYAHVLSVHLRTHTGDKKFKCTRCGKGFTKKAYLMSHLSVHPGVSNNDVFPDATQDSNIEQMIVRTVAMEECIFTTEYIIEEEKDDDDELETVELMSEEHLEDADGSEFILGTL